MAAIPIYIENLEIFRAELRRAEEAVQDLTVPLRLIAWDMIRSEREIFALQGPGQYVDLSTGSGRQRKFLGLEKSGVTYAGGYKLQKLKRWGFIYPILKASGALERSLTNPTDPNAVQEIVNKNTLIFGTRVVSKRGFPYPAALQFGARLPHGNLPARPYLFIDDKMLHRFTMTLNASVIKMLRTGTKEVA